uniref:Uncharacterized protein n=1 Tax=Rhizophora mucronata TaxID=61149 RepID=A0A2P2PFY0_RHIMU
MDSYTLRFLYAHLGQKVHALYPSLQI